jgi:hypothetical protein
VRLGPSLAAALLNGLFEQPEYFNTLPTVADLRDLRKGNRRMVEWQWTKEKLNAAGW